MKTYTRHSIAGWDVYTDDETGRVHHLVDPDSNDPRTLYPYIPAAGGGWDNACGSLTPVSYTHLTLPTNSRV